MRSSWSSSHMAKACLDSASSLAVKALITCRELIVNKVKDVSRCSRIEDSSREVIMVQSPWEVFYRMFEDMGHWMAAFKGSRGEICSRRKSRKKNRRKDIPSTLLLFSLCFDANGLSQGHHLEGLMPVTSFLQSFLLLLFLVFFYFLFGQ